MRPFDMDNILRPGTQLPAPVGLGTEMFDPKHMPYFTAKPYDPNFVMQTSNLTTEARKQPG